MTNGVSKLKETLASCRRVTVCLDGWSKKGLTASFLGISACFFDPTSNKSQHAFLGLERLQHPHTGEMLSTCLERSLTNWGIPQDKVMLIVSDNGANMVKAVRLLQERVQLEQEQSGDLQSDSEDELDTSHEEGFTDDDVDGDHGGPVDLIVNDIPYRRMGCLAHTLQLVIKQAYNGNEFKDLLVKTHNLVRKVRKSSVAMEKIMSKCGKSVIGDNATRWNSTYIMAKRLIEIKIPMEEAIARLGIDSLLTSEWGHLEELVSLLEPFATHTDTLQSDCLSLSYIIPSILDLEAHLEQFQTVKPLTTAMLIDIRRRFQTFLQPDCPDFNPLGAAACLLDPTCATVILGFDQSTLRDAAKMYILTQVNECEPIIYSQHTL